MVFRNISNNPAFLCVARPPSAVSVWHGRPALDPQPASRYIAIKGNVRDGQIDQRGQAGINSSGRVPDCTAIGPCVGVGLDRKGDRATGDWIME